MLAWATSGRSHSSHLHRALSKEDLTLKLDTAAERRKRHENEKVQKAHEVVARVKDTNTRVKTHSKVEATEKLSRLHDKLDHAAEAKSKKESRKKQELESHATVVKQRKEAATQDYPPSPGHEEISRKLNEAEERRKALEHDKINKVTNHLQVYEQRSRTSSANGKHELEEKLNAAERRRKEQEKQLQEKLAAAEEHAKIVRTRKSAKNSLS
ncbi:hypothetical protein ROZALSC1DRAFT_29699 [Rozella allomycis CSF55]|uniref:Uncharacterized protein n=1 Tax=Rozella allomycis (strain CSF55) TaxID=988480 RepID=A0A075B1N3_ROZAC|nr:hypothetical protein O9G_005151 [Rozella allomycis CSF55]RKP18634.1 hypothetical protein ROZALSC1DRAFT_29699 [Rozella allomycis CSF55]|eukprot:EPZ36268.1 hypothetical protein O9G_005151 [Rozella allomycis CSF55]